MVVPQGKNNGDVKRRRITGCRYSEILPAAPQALTVFGQTPRIAAASRTFTYLSRTLVDVALTPGGG
jgi:hypothetical protein